MLKLSIVIATKDRPQRLEKCLAAISKQRIMPCGIIIVDGSAKPFTSSILNIIKKRGTKIIYRNRKSSMVEARNIGVRNASGGVVLFLDDDAFIEKDYIEQLLEFYKTHPEAGGAEGCITNEKGSKLLQRISNFPAFPGKHDIMRVWRLHGCNMSFRKEVFSNFMFNENLIGYYNDDDEFCGRVAKKYKLFFVPSAQLVHDQTQYGGARIDNYRNYNTLVFNQFYSLSTIHKKDVFDIFGYILSQIVMVIRAFVFVKHNKYLAIKGILRGYRRILYSLFRSTMEKELKRL